jgi:hypothetical protein
MNNTDKLILSDYLVKQANILRFLSQAFKNNPFKTTAALGAAGLGAAGMADYSKALAGDTPTLFKGMTQAAAPMKNYLDTNPMAAVAMGMNPMMAGIMAPRFIKNMGLGPAKQANFGRFLQGAKQLGMTALQGAKTPFSSVDDMANMFIPQSMGGRYANFNKDVLTRGLGGLGAIGGIGSAGYAFGRDSGMNEGLDLGRRQGTAETSKKFISGLINKYKKEKDQGYFGRLFDSVTNKGF